MFSVFKNYSRFFATVYTARVRVSLFRESNTPVLRIGSAREYADPQKHVGRAEDGFRPCNRSSLHTCTKNTTSHLTVTRAPNALYYITLHNTPPLVVVLYTRPLRSVHARRNKSPSPSPSNRLRITAHVTFLRVRVAETSLRPYTSRRVEDAFRNPPTASRSGRVESSPVTLKRVVTPRNDPPFRPAPRCVSLVL